MVGLAELKRNSVLPRLPVVIVGTVERLLFVAVIGEALVNTATLSGVAVPAMEPGLPRLNVGVPDPPSLTKVRLAKL